MSAQKILQWMDQLDSEKGKLAIQKEMLADYFANNESYLEAEEKANRANKEFRELRTLMMQDGDCAVLVEDIKELQAEIKDTRINLSDEVIQYFAQEDSLVIEDWNGNDLHLKLNGKVSKTES